MLFVSVMYERMRGDQRKFGKAAWGAAVERMEKLQYAVSKETLQLMRAKEICLEQRKHGLREEVPRGHTRFQHKHINVSVTYPELFLGFLSQMQGLEDGEDAMARLDHLEALYYELQLQLYEIQFEILKYEELLLTAQLQSLRRQMTGQSPHEGSSFILMALKKSPIGHEQGGIWDLSPLFSQVSGPLTSSCF